jgi:hypothetical protein
MVKEPSFELQDPVDGRCRSMAHILLYP